MGYQAIGFANKFYTLWTITDECKSLGNGRIYKVTHYSYIKNISMDKGTAIAKYPNAILDDNLKGMTRSWNSKPQIIWETVDTYRFGKYKYEKLDEVDDPNYLAWYWNQIENGEHKDYISKVLATHGYNIRKWYTKIGKIKVENTYLVSPEDVKINREKIERINILENMKNNNQPIELNITRNPNWNGDYMDNNIKYHFQEVGENYYNEFCYYLPKLNGNQKRIKNKTILITDYTINRDDNDATVEILNFIIKK